MRRQGLSGQNLHDTLPRGCQAARSWGFGDPQADASGLWRQRLLAKHHGEDLARRRQGVGSNPGDKQAKGAIELEGCGLPKDGLQTVQRNIRVAFTIPDHPNLAPAIQGDQDDISWLHGDRPGHSVVENASQRQRQQHRNTLREGGSV